jgi:hypothetical protein
MATTTADVRAWAKDQGLQVGDRGRIPVDVLQAFERATSSRRTAATKRAAKTSSAPPTVGQRGPDIALERRVADLESQVASLTERLDSAVIALATRSGPFRRSRKK